MSLAGWARWQRQLQAFGERRLILVCGERSQVLAFTGRMLAELNPAAGLWSGLAEQKPHPQLEAVSPGSGRRWLGREVPLLVWDGWAGNPPDSQVAFAGTLQAGGLWFWLMPPLEEWGSFEDPDYQRSGLDNARYHPFAARLARRLPASGAVVPIAVTSADMPLPPPPELATVTTPFKVAATGDQQQTVEAIVATGLGRRRRPLVITADRGRGKSAALGMAAVRLLEQGRQQLLVTGPSAGAVQTLFRHAAGAAGIGHPPAPGEPVVVAGGRLTYMPPDELLRHRPPAEVLLVDEAAALSVPVLKSLLLSWPRVVFASTVHGYEGSGRGFALRFRAILDRETPHWQSVTLNQPVRWSATDPLEPLVNELWLPAETAELPEPVPGVAEVLPWSPATADESELRQAFGLLVNAHYRTSPADLRQWLDDPEAISWVARSGKQIVGVLWAAREGGLARGLAEQVALGKRRLRGHLLAQSLAHHGVEPEAAERRWLRVVRVAVEAGYRRQGLAGRLVAAARNHARSSGLDGLGTSFGASVGLVRFWRYCGLTLVRAGIQPEASTGEHAVQMLEGLSAEGQALQLRLTERFGQAWPALLPVIWPQLDPELVLMLTADLESRPAAGLDEQDLRELNAFIGGGRGFELTLPVLRRLGVCTGAVRLLQAQAAQTEERAGIVLWVRAVLQQQPLDNLRLAGLVQGRREAEQTIRRLARLLAEAVVSENG